MIAREFELKTLLLFFRPEHVASSIIGLIEKEEKRAVWAISNNEPAFAIEFPHYSQLKV